MMDEKKYLRDLRKRLLADHDAYMNTAHLVHTHIPQTPDVAAALTAAGLAIDAAVHAIENSVKVSHAKLETDPFHTNLLQG